MSQEDEDWFDILMRVDENISGAIVLPLRARPLLKVIEYAVHGFPWIIVSSITAVFAYAYRWNENVQYGLLVLNIGLLVDLAAVGLVKIIVQRERPVENVDDQVFEAPIADQYSFPSGHTSRATMLGVLLSYFFPRLTPIGVVFPLMVAYSRVAMGRHYFTDVIGGLTLGGLLGGLVLLTPMVVNRWMKKLFS
uniref:Phosphatidic acid phosphatase type 2/haloperoxidase domain-containing protein n=1 Tax=Pristionchus pacificus TaxID=54126 RepID=A0A8R1Z7Z3_PRIPA